MSVEKPMENVVTGTPASVDNRLRYSVSGYPSPIHTWYPTAYKKSVSKTKLYLSRGIGFSPYQQS